MDITPTYGFPHLDGLKNTVYASSFEGTLSKICAYVSAFFKDLGHNLSLFFNSLFGRVESVLPEHKAALNALTSLKEGVYVRKAVAATIGFSLKLSPRSEKLHRDGEPSNRELGILFKDLLAAKQTPEWNGGLFILPTMVLPPLSNYETECEQVLLDLKPFLDLIGFAHVSWAGFSRVSETVLESINHPGLTTLTLPSSIMSDLSTGLIVDAPLIKRCCPSLKTLIVSSLPLEKFSNVEALRENREALAHFEGFEIRVGHQNGALLNLLTLD